MVRPSGLFLREKKCGYERKAVTVGTYGKKTPPKKSPQKYLGGDFFSRAFAYDKKKTKKSSPNLLPHALKQMGSMTNSQE